MVAFEVGEIVWSKMKGFPWWPAVVLSRNQVTSLSEQKDGQRLFKVRFLVDFEL